MRIKIAGLCGSLRKDSYNRLALQFAQTVTPPEAELEILEIGALPFFNEDLESNPPPKVLNFKEKVKEASALIIATPEYNYSIPAVLKNALEWASRPPGHSPLENKPAAVMGASTGLVGTARAQNVLRQIGVHMNLLILNRPLVLISSAQDKFINGKLEDIKTKEKITELVQALINWTIKLH